jgi:hypothetical protein
MEERKESEVKQNKTKQSKHSKLNKANKTRQAISSSRHTQGLASLERAAAADENGDRGTHDGNGVEAVGDERDQRVPGVRGRAAHCVRIVGIAIISIISEDRTVQVAHLNHFIVVAASISYIEIFLHNSGQQGICIASTQHQLLTEIVTNKLVIFVVVVQVNTEVRSQKRTTSTFREFTKLTSNE